MVGTGLPEALHSKVTSVPFFTTILPSAGLGLTRGGTETETHNIYYKVRVTEIFRLSFALHG